MSIFYLKWSILYINQLPFLGKISGINHVRKWRGLTGPLPTQLGDNGTLFGKIPYFHLIVKINFLK